ncbi:MAG: hypothetical protein ABSA52_03275 [Candidatus Binatia bacterium]
MYGPAGFASPVRAQLQKGRVEAGLLLGGGAPPDGSDHRARYLVLRMLGFSVTDAWQVGLGIGLTGDFETSPSTALQGQALYHLAPTATIIPYVGAHAGGQADVFSASPRIQEVLGPQMGAKLRCGEKVLLIVDLRYSMRAAQPDGGTLFLSVGFGLIERPGVQHAEPPETEGGTTPQLQPPAEE